MMRIEDRSFKFRSSVDQLMIITSSLGKVTVIYRRCTSKHSCHYYIVNVPVKVTVTIVTVYVPVKVAITIVTVPVNIAVAKSNCYNIKCTSKSTSSCYKVSYQEVILTFYLC